MKQYLKLMVCGLAFSLSACSILPSSAKQTVYTLPQNDIAVSTATTASRQILLVDKPYASRFLNTESILVLTPQNELSIYADARWEDFAPIVFRDSLVQTIRQSKLFKAVNNESSTEANLDLKIYLNKFQVVYVSGQPQIQISADLNLSFLEKASSPVVSKHFYVTEAVNGTQLPEVITAFGRANGLVQQQILQWLIQEIQN